MCCCSSTSKTRRFPAAFSVASSTRRCLHGSGAQREAKCLLHCCFLLFDRGPADEQDISCGDYTGRPEWASYPFTQLLTSITNSPRKYTAHLNMAYLAFSENIRAMYDSYASTLLPQSYFAVVEPRSPPHSRSVLATGKYAFPETGWLPQNQP